MLWHSEETAATEYFLQENMKNVANTYEEMVNLMSQGKQDILTDLEYVYSDGLRVQKNIILSMVKAKHGLLKNGSLTELKLETKNAKNVKDLEASDPSEKATKEARSEKVKMQDVGKLSLQKTII